jgi:hypothetical protein
MPPRSRTILVVVVAVVAVFSAGAYAYWFFLIRGPLAGETAHDFGDVPLYEDTAPVQYTFRLANRLSRPLTIAAIRPECGCTSVSDVHKTLQIGEAFELPVTLTVKGGPRTVLIYVIFSDDHQQTLRLKATGKPQPRLSMGVPAAVLNDDGTAQILFTAATYESYDPPLTAQFQGWTLRYQPKDVSLTPTFWEGRVLVRFRGSAKDVSVDSSITLSIPPAQPLTVAIQPPGTVLPTTMAPPFNPPTLEEREPASRPRSQRLGDG